MPAAPVGGTGHVGRRGAGGCGGAGRLQLVPDPPVVNKQMTFTAVTDPSIAAYGWDLNDNGSYGDATGPQIRRTFRDVRTYEIGLADRRRPRRRQPASGGP